MILVRILGLSILAACLAAAGVWFLWGLVENLAALRKTPATEKQDPSPEQDDRGLAEELPEEAQA